MTSRRTGKLDVQTGCGVVRGVAGHGVRSWLGIPYAVPPVGDLRLRAPRPPRPWTGRRECTLHGDVPPQERLGAFIGAGPSTAMSEDCLTLNVVAPGPSSPRLRPVMVYLFGGAFLVGSSAVPLYSGRSLVRRGDVVYVSLNYRLGALGFLDFSNHSRPDRPYDNNLGLRDQVAALCWVRDNISAFGGDPTNVTIFGESAGGISVTTLMTVPAARGLFHRAIAQSAAPGAVHGPELARELAGRYLEHLGGPERLETATAPEIVHATKAFTREALHTAPGGAPVGPVVDGDFLPRHPLDAFAEGESAPVPFIVGTNDREGTLFFPLGDVFPTTTSSIERMFAQTDPAARERVLAAYGTANERDIGGDSFFWHPTVVAADGHSTHAPTYVYRYDFATRLLRWLGLGATHGVDLFAVFGAANSLAGRVMGLLGDRDAMRRVHRRVQERWLHFARHGTPGTCWPAYEPERRRTLVINEVEQVLDDPRAERRRAWHGYRSYF